MAGEKEKLSKNKVNNISGGYLIESEAPAGYNSNSPRYCVLDSEGTVLRWFDTRQEASDYAKQYNISDQKISWEQFFAELAKRHFPPPGKRARKS